MVGDEYQEKTDPSGFCSSLEFTMVRYWSVDYTSYCRIYHFLLTKAINPIIDTFCYSYSRGASVSALELSTGYATFLFASRNYMHDQSSFNVLAFYTLPRYAYRYPQPQHTVAYHQVQEVQASGSLLHRAKNYYHLVPISYIRFIPIQPQPVRSLHVNINYRHLRTFKQRIT